MKVLSITNTNTTNDLIHKYYDKYIAASGVDGIALDGKHHFWHHVENKFKFKIVWESGSKELRFENDGDYLLFVLKELQ